LRKHTDVGEINQQGRRRGGERGEYSVRSAWTRLPHKTGDLPVGFGPPETKERYITLLFEGCTWRCVRNRSSLVFAHLSIEGREAPRKRARIGRRMNCRKGQRYESRATSKGWGKLKRTLSSKHDILLGLCRNLREIKRPGRKKRKRYSKK